MFIGTHFYYLAVLSADFHAMLSCTPSSSGIPAIRSMSSATLRLGTDLPPLLTDPSKPTKVVVVE